MKEYYLLTKPGIIRGNAITAAAGFFLASKGHINFLLFMALLIGLSLVIASACVFNNILDRKIDQTMERTRNRALVRGRISVRSAEIYATTLVVLGWTILTLYTNILTAIISFVGFIAYVIIYGYAKRKTVHGTLVGTISGATPIVAGYCAVTNRIDGGAALLFLILVLWQMPHFFGIAMYRHNDYSEAKIPVLPLSRGMKTAKIQTLIYIIGFTIAAAALTVFGYTGLTYLSVAIFLGSAWFILGLKNFKKSKNEIWGRSMFLFSLIVISLLSVVISLDSLLP